MDDLSLPPLPPVERRLWDIRTWPRWVLAVLIVGGIGCVTWAALRSRDWISKRRVGPAAALRSLYFGQEQFRNSCPVDQDDDGKGEYGWLGEMAGVDACRGFPWKMDKSPFVARVLGEKDGSGRASYNGYVFHLALPDGNGKWRLEPQKLTGRAVPSEADAQEQRWLCYAWPGPTHLGDKRTYFADQTREIWYTQGEVKQYSGANGPRVSAAFVRDSQGPPTAAEAPSYLGADGNTWTLLAK